MGAEPLALVLGDSDPGALTSSAVYLGGKSASGPTRCVALAEPLGL